MMCSDTYTELAGSKLFVSLHMFHAHVSAEVLLCRGPVHFPKGSVYSQGPRVGSGSIVE